MLPEPFIKICSLREPHQAEFAVAAGADAIGLIFAEARRRIPVDQAVEIVRELRRVEGGSRTLVVGVFADQSADVVNDVAERVGLDIVQLHGSESIDTVASIERPVVKVVRPSPERPLDAVRLFRTMDRPPLALLMDGASALAVGGTGTRADWRLATQVARSERLILAGGLTPENVEDAIQTVRPIGVDVSSGVETDGVKDLAKVMAFVSRAREAFAALDLREGGIVPCSEAAEPVHRA